jgi:hypothetical protein
MSEYISFIVSSWQQPADSTMHWKVHCTRGDQEICFPDATFVVRTWIENDGQVVRCLIRHIQSGREVQFQSGQRALEFVRAWLGGDSSQPVECDLTLPGDQAEPRPTR